MGNKEVKTTQFDVESKTLYSHHIRRLQAKFRILWDTQDERVFKEPLLKYLDLPPVLSSFGERLFDIISSHTELEIPVSPRHKHKKEEEDKNKINFRQIVYAFEKVFRANVQQQICFLFDMYKKDNMLGEEQTRALLSDCAYISELNRVNYMEDTMDTFNEDVSLYDKRIDSVIKSISNIYKFPVDQQQFLNYTKLYLPSVAKALEFFIWYKFLRPTDEEGAEPFEFWPPYLLSSNISQIPELNSLIWLLACALEINEGTWKVIYAAGTHGRSLNRLVAQSFGYGGPTLLMLQDGEGGIFGAYTSEIWTSKADFREDKTSFLFSLAPNFVVCRASGVDANNIYLYSSSKQHVQFPLGIGFGGILRAYRLWINEDLDRGETRDVCASYARGKLTQSHEFALYLIEIWGCGGEKAEAAQQRAQVAKEKEIEQRRKVKKEFVTETWDSGPSKFMMDIAGRTGVSDEFLEDVRNIRKMREEQREKEKAAFHKKDT